MAHTKSPKFASNFSTSLGFGAKLWLVARPKGKNGGQFYTPCCAVRRPVEMVAPNASHFYIYDRGFLRSFTFLPEIAA